ncbi:MAG TPA: PhnA-like protein [Hyphomicrobiaceae bacterium]|jgi:hypothetical protein|nr:PhnA-like protein [Hyphomicrobiaceae bacterium]
MASFQPETARSRGDPDAPHVTPVTPDEDMRTILINRISWGAVFGGVVIALATQLVLNLLGIGIGAATIDPASGTSPSAATFSVGAAIWWTLSGILAALAGGYAAGRLAGQPKQASGGWHGLTAWALSTLVIFALLTTTIGAIAGGSLRFLGGVAGGAAQTLSTSAQTAVQAIAPAATQAADPLARIEKAVRDASGGNDPAALRDAAVSAIRAAMTSDPAQVQDARDRAAQALAKAQGVPTDDARAQIARYEQQYRQAVEEAKQQATAAAQTATTAVSRGALLSSIALLLGAIAAWFAGRMGAVDPTITTGDVMVTRRPRLH